MNLPLPLHLAIFDVFIINGSFSIYTLSQTLEPFIGTGVLFDFHFRRETEEDVSADRTSIVSEEVCSRFHVF